MAANLAISLFSDPLLWSSRTKKAIIHYSNCPTLLSPSMTNFPSRSATISVGPSSRAKAWSLLNAVKEEELEAPVVGTQIPATRDSSTKLVLVVGGTGGVGKSLAKSPGNIFYRF